jgi:hypothetical protein
MTPMRLALSAVRTMTPIREKHHLSDKTAFARSESRVRWHEKLVLVGCFVVVDRRLQRL